MIKRLMCVVGAMVVLCAGPALAQLPAMRDRPLSAAERVRLTALENDIQRISVQRNTSVAAVRAIARKLGARLTSTDPGQILDLIDRRTADLVAARDKITELEGQLETLDSMRLARAVQPLLEAANAAIEAGDLDLAEEKLAAAADQFGSARSNLQGQVDDLALRQADVVAQRAVVRSSIFDFEGAADLFEEAADLVPSSQPVLKRGYLGRASGQLAEMPNPQVMDRSLRLIEDMLALVPRDTYPAEWAITRISLGDHRLAQTRDQWSADIDHLSRYRDVVAMMDEAEPLLLSDKDRATLISVRAAALAYIADLTRDDADRRRALESARSAYAQRLVVSSRNRPLFAIRLAEQIVAAAPEVDKPAARREAILILREEIADSDAVNNGILSALETLARLIGQEARASADPALYREEIALRDAALARFPPVFHEGRAYMLFRAGVTRGLMAELSEPPDPVLMAASADQMAQAARLHISAPGDLTDSRKRLAVLGCLGAIPQWTALYGLDADADLLSNIDACADLTEGVIDTPLLEPKFRRQYWLYRAEALELGGAALEAALDAFRRAEAVEVDPVNRMADHDDRIREGLARLGRGP